MQTFMPYPSFTETARCLDYRRLGKQRIEARQIIGLLEEKEKGVDISKLPWGNHPAVKLWDGYLDSLKIYYNTIVYEWISRGYENNLPIYHVKRDKFIPPPPWFGDRDFHDRHKSNLLRKNSEYYSQFGWEVPDNLKYKWN